MGKFSTILKKSGYDLDSSTAGNDGQVSAERESGVSAGHKDIEAGEHAHHRPEAEMSDGRWDERLVQVTSFRNEIAESFKVLRSKILHPPDGRPVPRSIMVTSALPQEGKSFVSANLGISLAKGVDQHSLLVDCDLRLPSMARLLGVNNDNGLVDYLRDGARLPQLIRKTAVDKLSILPSGTPPVNPSELLGSARMEELVDELSSRYPDRFVIFDTPPLQVASESIVLSQMVDAVVLVIRHGIAGRPLIQRMIADIGKSKIIGVVFNGHTTNFITSKLIDKNHYYYGNYYGKKEE